VTMVYPEIMACPVKLVHEVIVVHPDSEDFLVTPVPLEGPVRTERGDLPGNPVTEE